MKISIIGLGWFGSSLAEALKDTHTIVGSTRSEEKVREFLRLGIKAEVLTTTRTPSPLLMDADVIVLNIPPFIDQVGWFKSWQWRPETHVIFISSTSVYGQEEGTLAESDPALPESANGHILVEEEDWIKTLPAYTIIRFGGLVGPTRHPGKFLSGRKELSGGNQPVNLIHQEDTVGFTKLVIEKRLTQETFNLVSPDHPTRRDYYGGYCAENKLPLPEFKDALVPGKTISADKVSRLYEFKVRLNCWAGRNYSTCR